MTDFITLSQITGRTAAANVATAPSSDPTQAAGRTPLPRCAVHRVTMPTTRRSAPVALRSGPRPSSSSSSSSSSPSSTSVSSVQRLRAPLLLCVLWLLCVLDEAGAVPRRKLGHSHSPNTRQHGVRPGHNGPTYRSEEDAVRARPPPQWVQ
jgi:hypothetical protein